MEANWIDRQPLWIALALALMALNTILLNDLNPWLAGAESDLVGELAGLFGERVTAFPFWLRLPGLLCLFAGLAAGYFLGKRFFGKETMLLTLMVLAGSLLLPNASKWVSADPWLWVFLLLAIFGMLGYLKRPNPSWKWLTWLAWAPAILLQPVGALLGVLATALVWRFRHPDGKRLDKLWLYLIGPPLAALALWWNKGQWDGSFLLLSLDPGQWSRALPAQLLGMLPWLGFLLAGLVEMARNQSKKEELAVLTTGMLTGAVLTNSLWVQWVFALLVAKQLQRFLSPGYPFGNLVKTVLLLQLIAYILLGIIGMMYGFGEWGASGFRAGMSTTLACWAPALFGAFGLFGKNQRMTVLGLLFSGLLLSLAFWTQLLPLLKQAG